MSSSRRIINPADSTVFTTRVAGQNTSLFAVQYPFDPGDFRPRFSWHKELCCEDNHVEVSWGPVDISAAGALVTVRNLDSKQIMVWTDYI